MVDLHEPEKKCPVCKDDLEDIDAICCGKESCIHIIEQTVTDNQVTEFVKNNPKEAIFHIKCALKALYDEDADKIYEPVPAMAFHEEDKQRRFKMSIIENKKDKKDFTQLRSMLEKYITGDNPSKLITIMSRYDSDKELENKIGNELYSWCKFTFSTSLCSLKYDELKDNNGNKLMEIFEVQNQSWTTAKENTIIRFHGSREKCWYSILRNGLQVLSNSDLMKNGKAYGEGIYTSNNIRTSYGYGRWIAVCWVNKLHTKHTSRDDITIVTKSSAIQIRALILIPNNFSGNELYDLNSILYQRYEMPKKTEVVASSYKGPRNRKIFNDYKLLMKNLSDVIVEFNDDTFLKFWTITLKDHKKFSKLGGEITVEYHFSPNYPFTPPFVRMVRPRFKPMTGHITRGGAVCMKDLTLQGWESTRTVYNIMQAIKDNIEEGGGELDSDQRPYSLNEAKESFERVKLQHGWT